VNGFSIHARAQVNASSSANPVVLVHGIGVSSRYMLPTATGLRDRFSVYAPDLPGFGLSTKPKETLDVSALADALAAWMEATRIPPAALVGNSFGCQVVAQAAACHPQRARSAVLIGPTVDPVARAAARQVARWILNAPPEPLSLAPVILRDYRDAGLRRVIETFREALTGRIEEKLPQIRIPTLVMRGAEDAIVPQRWAEEATDLLPLGRLAVIAGAAHTVNYSAPRDYLDQLAEFIARPSAAG
jgi:2-hydroxy-6-oxonona-2,4-dienedioate hydrolase